MRSFAKICFIVIVSSACCQKELTDFIQTDAKSLPYQAVIFNKDKGWYTVGALISPKYVIAMANGVRGSSNFIVYLGISESPKFKNPLADAGAQIIASSKALIHEDYGIVKKTGQYIYDVALIELNGVAQLTDTVKLARLPSKNMFPLKRGLYANVIAFKLFEETGSPAYATVQIRDRSKCKLFFGDSFLESEEICVRQKDVGPEFNSHFARLPLVIDGTLVGLARTRLSSAVCQVTSGTCHPVQVYTSLENCLDWIYENVDIGRKDDAKGRAENNINEAERATEKEATVEATIDEETSEDDKSEEYFHEDIFGA